MTDKKSFGANMRRFYDEAEKFSALHLYVEDVHRAVAATHDSALKQLGMTLHNYLVKEEPLWEENVRTLSLQLIEARDTPEFAELFPKAMSALQTKMAMLCEEADDHLGTIGTQNPPHTVAAACKSARAKLGELQGKHRS